MAKRKNSLSKSLPLVLFVLGIVVVCMGFLAGVTYKPENMDPSSYTLFDITFGKELSSGGLEGIIEGKTTINFSILATLGLFLPLVGALISNLLKGRIGALVSALCFIASAVLLFLVPQITSVTVEISSGIIGSSTSSVSTFKELDYQLGVGTIIAGSLSSLGALVSLFLVVKD